MVIHASYSTLGTRHRRRAQALFRKKMLALDQPGSGSDKQPNTLSGIGLLRRAIRCHWLQRC
jgi:hypothetical protein